MANAIDEELKRQARMLGLGQWRPDAEDEVDEETAAEAAAEAKRLASFAGLRQDPEAAEDVQAPLLSPLAEMCDTVDELLQLGLDGLKAELQRIGLKCGGTAQERAERLFQTKGKRALTELPAGLIAKVAPPDDEAKKRARVFDQQGPLLPGKKRKQVVRKGPPAS